VSALAAWGDAIAACDRLAGAVVVLDGRSAVRVDGLDGPEGVALGPEGLFVAEAGAGRVTRLDARGDGKTVVADGLPFGFPVPRPRGDRRCSLARRADGSLLVGCDGDGSVRAPVAR
jgi:hypothetical protein